MPTPQVSSTRKCLSQIAQVSSNRVVAGKRKSVYKYFGASHVLLAFAMVMSTVLGDAGGDEAASSNKVHPYPFVDLCLPRPVRRGR